MIPNLKDTIAALSTPQGQGAIAVVRLSGPIAFEITESIFKPQYQSDQKISHKLVHGAIVDEKKTIDDVLVSFMFETSSYTAEALVEIHGHGGMFVSQEILNLLIKKGARLAEPGEFTFRAFMNGKLDLTQAESVFDVIYAKNKKALQQANENLRGDFSNEIKEIRKKLLELLVHTEASIDFSTEDIEVFSNKKMLSQISPVQLKMSAILHTYEAGRLLMQGVQVAIVGRPNVGKSSLLNAFLKRNRAIVTAEAGTTRDTVEEEINYKDVIFKFIDTAGIRKAKNEAEKIGITKSISKMKAADIVVLMLDANQNLNDDDRALLDLSEAKKRIVVLNKVDLLQDVNVTRSLSTDVIPWLDQGIRKISALNSQGVDALLESIYKKTIDDKVINEELFLTKKRHKIALEKSLAYLDKFEEGLKINTSLEFLALDLKSSALELEKIIGKIDMEDVYDKIFSSFCIGK